MKNETNNDSIFAIFYLVTTCNEITVFTLSSLNFYKSFKWLTTFPQYPINVNKFFLFFPSYLISLIHIFLTAFLISST
jgi:hypothetical protein